MPKPFRFNDEFDQPGPQCPDTSPSPVDILEPLPIETQAALFSQMAELLTPVLLFIADGRRGGTMDIRSWVVLYVVKPEAIANESMVTFAKRRGISQERVCVLVRQFRRLIPAYKPNRY